MIKAIPYPQFISYFVLIIISFEILSFSSIAEEEKQIIPVSDDEFPHWRYWNGDEDCEFIWVSTFNTDQNGNLYTVKEQNSFMFDGYDFVSLPFQRKTHALQTGVNNQFWHETEGGIEVFSETGSHNIQLSHRIEQNNDVNLRKYTTISLHSNQFYIITKDELYWCNTQRNTKEVVQKSKDTNIGSYVSIQTDHMNSVWIAGEYGMIEFDISKTKSLKGQPFNQYQYPIGNSQIPDFFCVYPNREISINLKNDEIQLYHLKNGKWNLLYSDKDFYGWLGHDGGFWILKRLEDGSKRIQFHLTNKIYEMVPNKYTNSVIKTIVFNKEMFWLSSHNGLVSFHAPVWRRDESMPPQITYMKTAQFTSPKESLLMNERQLLVNQNNVWKSFEVPLNGMRKNLAILIADHFRDNDNKLLVFGREIYKYSPHSFDPVSKFLDIDDFIHTYFIDNKNQIYFSLNEKKYTITKFLDGKLEPIFQLQSPIDSINFNDFIIRNNGGIWFINAGQLHHVIDDQITSTSTEETYLLGKLQHLLYRNNDNIILSGQNGIFEWNGTEYAKLLDKNIGYIFDYQETELNDLWLATHNGVYQYRDRIWLENNRQEGLPDGRHYFIKTDIPGNMYVGGGMGMRVYHPNSDIEPPETYISKEVNSSEFMVQKDIRIQLSGKDRWNYTQPDRLLYSYKIKQIDFIATEESEWSAFQEDSTINLSHLKPMNYTIYARAMDRNMNIDPTPASFNFRVSPPWFYEPIFLVISTIGTILITIFGYYAVRNHLKLVDSLHQTQRSVSLLERTKIRLTEAKTKAENEKQNAITATKAKDGFLARMSHEIRTPLNGVIGNLELIPSSELKPEKQYYLHTAKISANTLLDIIGDVLDFAKIEADKLELEEISVSLPALFEETISLMKTRAEEKEISLTSHFSQYVPKAVRVDPVRLRQVMINLIGNAVKFTDQGSVNVSLTCDSILDEIAVICLEVKDTGTGFDSSRKDELFREFEQDDTSNKTAEGTGLGLAICKRIVEIMGGTIDCDSHPGFGSRFWITLPLRIIDESELEPTHTDDQSTAGQFHFEIQHPILVIDDKQTNLMLAKSQLSELRIDCDTAGGGQEALEKVKENAYSMILVDCSMPGMDGFEFTKEFRDSKNGTQFRIPVIAMTAHVVSDIQERCRAAGMDDYLSKPVRMDSLTLMLQKWLPSPGETTIMPEINEQDHVFSMEALSEFTSMRNPDDLVQYLTVVQQEMQSEYEQLLQAIQSQDRMVFRDRAHGLKGLSESVLFTPFAEFMKRYQEHAGHISLESVENDSPKINEMILQFQEFVQTVQMNSELNKKDATENVSSNK